MFAWGNQSCGRLGLQEKKMEKALLGTWEPDGTWKSKSDIDEPSKLNNLHGTRSCLAFGKRNHGIGPPRQVIFKPRLVRAEWGSIEAMSGADEETVGGALIT